MAGQKKMARFLLIMLTSLVCGSEAANRTSGLESVIADFYDLFDLIPYERLLPLYMNYAAEDVQLKKLLQYMKSECFKANLKSVQQRKEFNETAEFLSPLGVNLHHSVNEVYKQLQRYQALSQAMGELRKHRHRHNDRLHDDGLLGLIEQTVEVIPVQEIKHLYKDKLDNYQFRNVVEKRFELKDLLYQLASTEEFEFVSQQIIGMGIPLKEIVAFVDEEVINFFDLEYVTSRDVTEEYDDVYT